MPQPLSTLPERRQELQTGIFFFAPFTSTVTRWMLACQILLDLLCEWLTLLPK
jgi:hypothetical protein